MNTEQNISTTVPAYTPEKPNHLRTAVKNLIAMLIFQAVSWVMHKMVLGNMDPYRESSQAAERIPTAMFLFSIVALLVFGDILVGIYFKDSKRKRAYLDATSIEKRGAEAAAEGASRYRKLALTEGLVCTLSTAALWLIPTLIYTISLALSGRGYGYSEAMLIEEFFVSFIGLCELFQNAWIGWLIGVAVLFVFHYFGRLLAHSRWAAERIRR